MGGALGKAFTVRLLCGFLIVAAFLVAIYIMQPQAMPPEMFRDTLYKLANGNFKDVDYYDQRSRSQYAKINSEYGPVTKFQIDRIIDPRFSYPTLQAFATVSRGESTHEESYTFIVNKYRKLVLLGIKSNILMRQHNEGASSGAR